MSESKRPNINWMDVLWLLFLAGLALLPPVKEIHKQGMLLAFGIFQLGERWIVARIPKRGASLRGTDQDRPGHDAGRPYGRDQHQQQLLADLFFARRDGRGIFRAVGHASLDRAGVGRLTARISSIPLLRMYEITAESYALLAIRILFFFLAAMVVNRFVVESKRQTQALSGTGGDAG